MPQTYFVGDRKYNIPENVASQFLTDNPEAVKGIEYKLEDKSYLIPENITEKFLQDNPAAQAIAQEAPLEATPLEEAPLEEKVQPTNIVYEDEELTDLNQRISQRIDSALPPAIAQMARGEFGTAEQLGSLEARLENEKLQELQEHRQKLIDDPWMLDIPLIGRTPLKAVLEDIGYQTANLFTLGGAKRIMDKPAFTALLEKNISETPFSEDNPQMQVARIFRGVGETSGGLFQIMGALELAGVLGFGAATTGAIGFGGMGAVERIADPDIAKDLDPVSFVVGTGLDVILGASFPWMTRVGGEVIREPNTIKAFGKFLFQTGVLSTGITANEFADNYIVELRKNPDKPAMQTLIDISDQLSWGQFAKTYMMMGLLHTAGTYTRFIPGKKTGTEIEYGKNVSGKFDAEWWAGLGGKQKAEILNKQFKWAQENYENFSKYNPKTGEYDPIKKINTLAGAQALFRREVEWLSRMMQGKEIPIDSMSGSKVRPKAELPVKVEKPRVEPPVKVPVKPTEPPVEVVKPGEAVTEPVKVEKPVEAELEPVEVPVEEITFYHGTSIGGAENIKEAGFVPTKGGMNQGTGVSITSDKETADVFGEKREGKHKGVTLKVVIDKDVKLVNSGEFMDVKNDISERFGRDGATQKATDYFKEQGYDGIDFRVGERVIVDALPDEVRIWNVDKVKIIEKAPKEPVEALAEVTAEDVHKAAEGVGMKWDDDAAFMALSLLR